MVRKLAYLLAAMAPLLQAAEPSSEDRKFSEFFREYLEESLAAHPVYATNLGDHRYDDRLDDLSAQARAQRTTYLRKTLERLGSEIDRAKLTRTTEIDFEIFEHDLKERIWSATNLHPFEEDPRTYNDYLSGSVYRLLSQSSLPKETNIKNALARIRALPQVLAVAQETLKRPPLPVLETAIKQNRGVISFYQKGIYELVGETPQHSALKDACDALVESLQEHQQFLQTDLWKRAGENWRLGKDLFNRKLQFEMQADTTADEVLAQAEAEFTRVTNEMYVIARQVWHQYFPKTPLPIDSKAGRNETIARVLAEIGKEHGKPEDLVKDAQGTVAKLREFIRSHDILGLPEPDRCDIIEMPEFKRGNSLAYIQSAPPLDPNNRTIYAVSPPPADWSPARVESFLQEYNRHMLQVLTIHEAYPGHYVQLEYANREESPVRKILRSGVFIEGWAVYTEQMMLDQGYGDGDLALRLTQLKYYLRAVANAILDHLMHCTTMSDAEALDLLMVQSFQAEGEARLKIIRAKQSSVQLSTYFVGRMALYKLRQDIQQEMGEDFHLGRYHEAVLDHGSVPVKYLPELVRARLKQAR